MKYYSLYKIPSAKNPSAKTRLPNIILIIQNTEHKKTKCKNLFTEYHFNNTKYRAQKKPSINKVNKINKNTTRENNKIAISLTLSILSFKSIEKKDNPFNLTPFY